MGRPLAGSGAVLTAALVLGLVVPAHGAPAARPRPADPVTAAVSRLQDDADGALRIHRDGGIATFVGAARGTTVDDPSVDPSMSPVAAARAHLDRYGAAFGTDRRGTALVDPEVRHSLDGTDVVRWQQTVDGVPVVAGQAAVTLEADRDLAAAQADLSAAPSVPAAVVGETAARRAAERGARSTVVSDEGRWLLDPSVLGMPSSLGPRGVWRFVVAEPSGRTDVMVDDASGRVLIGIPLEESATRVVCDRNYVAWSSNDPEPACSTGFARAEGDPATGNVDVDDAYSFSGETAGLYESLGIPLTDLLGQEVTLAGGQAKALESTVNFCYSGTCPNYANAFWNGTGMYYGHGWASADDVVGHEMTHGFTQYNSNLAYWGQPGAINESLSDIMGEILDHRYGPAGEDNSAWLLGEDSPVGAIRSMKTPGLYGQPDSTTSSSWTTSPSDAGGVHTNSGVGNKTAYLISQGTAGETGGAFNGQSFAGIDAGDPALTKSAQLWAAVDEHLISGSDYADLGLVLDQECTALRTSASFTAGDCATVHAAGVATRLSTERSGVPTPAAQTCPTGSRRVLFDSDSASPHHGFTGTDPWHDPAYAGSTTAGLDHWAADDLATTSVTSLVATNPVALPPGQPSYLVFRHKFLLDFYYYSGAYYYYDGGTVAIDDVDDGVAPVTLTSGWTNGPNRPLQSPYSAVTAFSGDSIGWWTSKADLSAYAGKDVEPQFTLRTDSSYGMGGWEIDDVVVYTCDTTVHNITQPTVTGTPQVGATLTAQPGTWTDGATLAYQWLRDGQPVDGATATTYPLGAADLGAAISVRVTGTAPGLAPGTADSAATSAVAAGTFANDSLPSISGTPAVGQTLVADPGTWSPAATFGYQWLRSGTPIAGATGSSHPVVADDAGEVISVRVTASAPGYSDATADSAGTSVPPLAFDSTTTPSISGTPAVGQTLTADPGSWSPTASFTYQWRRGSTPIDGATSSTYRLVAADLGATISVRVVGHAPHRADTPATSAATTAVAAGTLTSTAPRISGTLRVGRKLTAQPGTWQPSGVVFSYRWYRDGKAIRGTHRTHKLVAADRGHRLRVRVTGRLAGYTTTLRSSRSTKPIR